MTDLRKILAEATPGPWRIVPDQEGEPAQCITAGGFDIATAWGGYLRDEADARLIALAPQLAAALIKAREGLAIALDDLDEWVGCKDSLEKAGFNMDDTADRAKLARSTLAEIDALMGGNDEH